MLYRCGFVHDPAAGDEMFLVRFDGVYYSARVWLNGVYLGDHEGYFAAFEFDVTAYLREGQNELLVEVYSPEESEENDKKTIGGVWARWDGMDPELNPGGIFRDVSLVSAGKVHFRTLGAAADHTGRGRVHLTLYAHEALRTTMVGRAKPLGFQAPGALASKEIRLEPGENRVELGFSLPRVRAWWTWDRGEQPMYEMTVSCGGAEQSVRFGARTVEMRDWQVYLNGVRTYLRGINHLPTDAYPARTTGDRSRADADLVREAGMNAVRVHAHVAEEEYYDACDARGLLVLQDFPLQWTHRRSVLEPAVRQAKEMARDLQRHPCVAIYLAHDEPFYVVPPEKWSVADILRTAAEVLSPRWALWQRRVLDPAVVRALEEEDPARPVIDAAGHPLTTNHLYFGWYYGKFRDLERVVNIRAGSLAATDGVWCSGAAEWAFVRGDLARRKAAGLGDALLQVQAPGVSHGALRAVEGRSQRLRSGEPGVPGGGSQARHRTLPAPQVPADGRNLRVHAQRPGTGHLLVGGRLESKAKGGLRRRRGGYEPDPHLCWVPEGSLRSRGSDSRCLCSSSTTLRARSGSCAGPGT